MRKSSPKSLHSVWLATAGLALLLLGASTPRLTAQQSWNFDSQTDTPFTRYQIPAAAGYGTPTWSFPTNTASSYAGNYAYRINVPAIVYDTDNYYNARAGAIWESNNALYGNPEDYVNYGRYSVGADVTAWNSTYLDEVFGVGSMMTNTTFANVSLVGGIYVPGAFCLGVAYLYGFPVNFQIWGVSDYGETVLNPTHQYRFVLSSYNASVAYGYAFHMLQLFDKGNTNTPYQSVMGVDAAGQSFFSPGYAGVFLANMQAPPPFSVVISGNQVGNNSTEGADATFDNYYAFQPAASSGPPYTMPAAVCATWPPPCGSAFEFYPTNLIEIIDQDSNVKDAADIHLYLDGVQIPDGSLNIVVGTGDPNFWSGGDGNGIQEQNPLNTTGAPTVFPGAVITYQMTNNFAPLSVHTNMVVFLDDGGVWHTNSWWWTSASPYLFASNSLPVGSLTVTGLATRTVWAPLADFGTYPGIVNCAAGSEMMLNNTTFPCNVRSTNQVQTVAWGLSATDGSITVGTPNLNPFPGLYYTNNSNNGFNSLCVQAQGYLQLAAGTNKFHIDSDDDVGIYSGGDAMNPGVIMYQSPYDTDVHTDFYVVAQAAGLYPVNIYYENGGGDGYCLLRSYDADNNLQIVGDVADGGIPAYILEPGALQVNITPSAAVTAGAQWQLDGGALHNNGDIVSGLMPGSHTVTYTAATGYTTPASTNVTVISTQTNITTGTYVAAGPTLWSTAQIQKSGTSWTQETGAVLSTVNQTLTLPTLPTANRYYHLVGSVQYKITKVQKVGSTVVFTYQ